MSESELRDLLERVLAKYDASAGPDFKGEPSEYWRGAREILEYALGEGDEDMFDND